MPDQLHVDMPESIQRYLKSRFPDGFPSDRLEVCHIPDVLTASVALDGGFVVEVCVPTNPS